MNIWLTSASVKQQNHIHIMFCIDSFSSLNHLLHQNGAPGPVQQFSCGESLNPEGKQTQLFYIMSRETDWVFLCISYFTEVYLANH